jgi:flagellar hook-associated protein FlgK
MSSFSGLSTGLSSLYAQRRGLELTGHNISNVNTEGYSRQRLDLKANGGPVEPALHSVHRGVGNGVQVDGVDRLRDGFLEARAVQERGSAAATIQDRVLLSRIEDVLAEPGDAGIQRQLADFWAGWDDVGNKPSSLAARSQLLERAQTLASGINGAMERLEVQWSASSQQLGATVQEVNSLATGVAEYNAAIVSATHAGRSPNDLMDKRDVLVQRLGELAGVTVRRGDAGSVDVVLAGKELVKGGRTAPLKVQGDPVLVSQRSAVVVAWQDPDDPAGPGAPTEVGGLAGGLRNGLNDVLPRYHAKLSAIASAVTEKVAGVHEEAAYDQDGAPGGAFFAMESGRLALKITDPRKVAASDGRSVDPSSGTVSGDVGGAKAAQIAALATAPGGPDDLNRQVVVALGVEAQAAGRRVDIQSNILAQIDAARESEAGVNLDEEMTNMLAFQRAYEGAARFVSAIDQMLDTLINRTGVVGR